MSALPGAFAGARTSGPWPAVVLAAALLAHLPALGAGFIWDDDAFLTDNPLIHASDGLRRFWLTTEPPDYFPLTSTTLWAEWRLFGGSAAGYHAVNLALHAVSSVLLGRCLETLGLVAAWPAALLFAVHPVGVESVAWITERKNVLAMPLALGALLAWLTGERAASPRRFRALAGMLFLLALLAKTAVVTLPPLLLLLSWWRRGNLSRRDLVRTAPLFLLALLLGLATVWYQTHRSIGEEVVREDGALSRIAIAARAVWFYLGKALFPARLSFVYPRWSADTGTVAAWLPLAGLLVPLGFAWRARDRWGRPVLLAAGAYLLALAPVLGFFDIYFMKYSLVADHWQYFGLPAIAAAVASAWAAAARRARREVRLGLALAGALTVIAFGALARDRAHAFKDAETLWRDTIAKNPSAWLAHSELGNILASRREHEAAVVHFEAALAAREDLSLTLHNLGNSLAALGRREEARARFGQALTLLPLSPAVHTSLGTFLAESGEAERGLDHLRRAVELDPGYLPALNNLGVALERAGEPEAAADAYRAALAIAPDLAPARDGLSRVAPRAVGARSPVR